MMHPIRTAIALRKVEISQIVLLTIELCKQHELEKQLFNEVIF